MRCAALPGPVTALFQSSITFGLACLAITGAPVPHSSKPGIPTAWSCGEDQL